MSNETVDHTIQLADTGPFVPTPVTSIKQIGPYKVVREIGRGAMGAVYLAEHKNLGRSVALKVLPPEFAVHDDRLKRFQREMAAVGCLEHEHVVLATDAGHADGYFFIAMQFIDGMDLDELLKRNHRLELPVACDVIRQAALGLQHIHENQLVHRDIKASNIAITNDGMVKILDLGIARLRQSEDVESSLTSDQAVMGTPDYMAPEQIQGFRDVDIRADIYSLGCTLYKLISGHAPFAGPEYKTCAAKLVAHVKDEPRSLTDYCPNVPPRFASLVHRMMAKSPDDRPATPSIIADGLAEWADADRLSQLITGEASPQPPVTVPPSPTTRRAASVYAKSPFLKSRLAICAMVAGVVLTVGAGVSILNDSGKPNPTSRVNESPATAAIVQSTSAIASSTQKIAESNAAIVNNTERMAKSIDSLREQVATNGVHESMRGNPLTFTVMPMPNGNQFMVLLMIAEGATDISYRIGESGEFQSTGFAPFAPVDFRTGKRAPNSKIELEATSPITLYVKYIDAKGIEHGPFSHDINPHQDRVDAAIGYLKSDPNSWVRLHEDGSVYFDLLMHWQGLSEVRYGVGTETPNQTRKVPSVDIDVDGQDYLGIDVPPSTPFISLQVTFMDGTKSQVVKVKQIGR